VDRLVSLKSKHGFAFLNSDHNDVFIEKMYLLEKAVLTLLNNEKLFAIYSLRKKVNVKREEEILNNIYNYSKEHHYQQAILFIGSAHRRSMMEKIKKYEMAGRD
jgi:hypothetical protein